MRMAQSRYTIEFTPAAVRELAAFPQAIRRLIARKIDALTLDPRPPGVEKLKGFTDQYRVRVGDFRIIYTIRDRQLIVLILRIGNRKDVYRGG